VRSRIVLLLLTALLGAVTAGCTDTPSESGDAGFVSGKGVITALPPGEREEPGPVQGTTIDGKPISLDDYAGQVVVVNVWGSWCAPCRSEADDLVAAHDRLADRDVAFLGSTPATWTRPRRARSYAASTSRTRASTTRAGARCWRSRARCRRTPSRAR
jgi:hypothetical protein